MVDSDTQERRDRPALDGLPKYLDRDSRYIDHLVERWNHWSRVSIRSDRENYINGNVEFVFDYGGELVLASCRSIGGLRAPRNVSLAVHNGKASDIDGREIEYLLSEQCRCDLSVISRWNQEPVFVNVAQLINQTEEFVPATFVIGPKAVERAYKAQRDFVGHSLLKSHLEVFALSNERELDVPVLIGAGVRTNYLPIRVIERTSHVEDRIADDDTGVVYNGFVLFGERGALSGLCVPLKDVCERSMFAEKFAKIGDVFRGPLNLEAGTVHHG